MDLVKKYSIWSSKLSALFYLHLYWSLFLQPFIYDLKCSVEQSKTLEKWVLQEESITNFLLSFHFRSIVVVAKAKGRAIKSFAFFISTKTWNHIQVSGSTALVQKIFLVNFHQQSHLFLVASNHTISFVFQARKNSWTEDQSPILDHEFLLNAEQVSVFQLSNKHNRLGYFT